MTGYEYLDKKGTFRLEAPERTGYLYFPIAGEKGLKGAVTPTLNGDLKLDQNTFVLQPTSAEDLMESKAGRNFWCIMEDGACWSAAGSSALAEAERFSDRAANAAENSLTAGPMWQCVRHTDRRTGLLADITSFVPVQNEMEEIMYVKLRNMGEDTLAFVPVAAVPLYARSADNLRDHRHVTSLLHRIYTTKDGVYVNPTLTFDERGHRKNTKTYFVTGCAGDGSLPVGFCPVLEDFTGEGGSLQWPERIVRNLPFEEPGKSYAGYEAIGALQFARVTLRPGEEAAYVIRIGVQEGADVPRRLFPCNAKEAEEALQRTRDYWGSRVNVAFETGNPEFDRWMYWVSFQPVLRRIYGCSFLPHHDYGRGGRGWRDLWQDCLALLIMNPEGVRRAITDNCAGIRMDGSNATIIGSRPGEFIADRNNITRVWMDHGFWPLFTVRFYIDQTGDLAVLLKKCTWFKDRQEMRGTAPDESVCPQDTPVLRDRTGRIHTGTVLEHMLVQNLTAFFDTGEHNHIRLRGADWNDALDMAPDRGESVAFTAAYAMNLDTLALLLRRLAEKEEMECVEVAQELQMLLISDRELFADSAKKQALLREYCSSCYPVVSGQSVFLDTLKTAEILSGMAEWIRGHIRETEWISAGDCGWFNSYYDNHGRRVEGCKNTDPESDGENVRMMLTGQVFTVMSGTAGPEQSAAIVRAADRYLYKKELGGYRLNTDFGELKDDLGRMFGFAYGHKENGAVFSHMAVMFGNALYSRGFAQSGYRALNSLFEQAADFPVSRIYPGIPEYFNDRGRGMYHYLTGAGSWFLMTAVTQMYGVRGSFGDLILEPKLLGRQFDAQGRAGLRLEFAGRSWHIVYCNREHLDYGDYQISRSWLNGKVWHAAGSAEVSCIRISREELKGLPREPQTVEVELVRRNKGEHAAI